MKHRSRNCKKLQQFVALNQLNANNRLNVDNLLDVAAASIDPVMADAVLQPVETAQQQLLSKLQMTWLKSLQVLRCQLTCRGQIALKSYGNTLNNDVAQRIQSDQAFAARLQKHNGQYTFQIQQAQNAQIGRVGTPADGRYTNTEYAVEHIYAS